MIKKILADPATGQHLGELQATSKDGKGFQVVGPFSSAFPKPKPGQPAPTKPELYQIFNGFKVAEITEQRLDNILDPYHHKRIEKAHPASFTASSDYSFDIHLLGPFTNLKRRGGQLVGPHPKPGHCRLNSTCTVFAIDEPTGAWYCRRHGGGGYALKLLAVLEGKISCEDDLVGEAFKETVALAVERGYITQPQTAKKREKPHQEQKPRESYPLAEAVKLPDWEADTQISVILRLDKDLAGERLVSYYKVHSCSPELDGEQLDHPKFLTSTAPTQKVLSVTDEALSEIHKCLVAKYNDHLYLVSDLDYDLMALQAEASHFREEFESYGYFDFYSVENDHGKTTAMKCLIWASFYGFVMIIPTVAVLFRSIEDTHSAVGIDQVDELFKNPKQNRDILTLLDSGHTKGIHAYRMNMDASPPEFLAYDPFGPKAFTRTGWIPPDLISRCHTVKMIASKGFKDVKPPPKCEEFAGLRDSLYAYRLRHHNDVAKAYAQVLAESGLSGRVRDIYIPMLTMAKIVGEELYRKVVAFAKKQEARRTFIKRDERVVVLVEYLVENKITGEYPVANIRNGLEPLLHKRKLLAADKELSSQTVIGWLEPLGFYKAEKRTGGYVHYEIDQAQLARLATVYIQPSPPEDPKPQTPPQGSQQTQQTSLSLTNKSEVSEVSEVARGVQDN